MKLIQGFAEVKNATARSMTSNLPYSEEVACGGYHTCVLTSNSLFSQILVVLIFFKIFHDHVLIKSKRLYEGKKTKATWCGLPFFLVTTNNLFHSNSVLASNYSSAKLPLS